MNDNRELALRAEINVLRNTIETWRMPSRLVPAPKALAMHAAAIAECERLLASRRSAATSSA